MDVTRFLGSQYLWIDVLCMVQDWDEDRDREIASMSEIYRNVTMNWVGTRACWLMNIPDQQKIQMPRDFPASLRLGHGTPDRTGP